MPIKETDPIKYVALLVAICIRNDMENFHCEHLSDAQMKELNPIIRNSIYSTLYAIQNETTDVTSQYYVRYSRMLVPPYWETPKLSDSFIDLRESCIERKRQLQPE